MRDIIITLIVFGSIPYILKRPYIGILVYCWLSYMNPHRLTWGFAYNMPFAATISITTILALLFFKESKKIPMSTLMMVWFMWILWMNVTTFFAMVPDAAFHEWERSMKIQLMSMVTLMLMKKPERIKWLVWVIALSIGFYGIKGGIFSILTLGNNLVWGPPGTFFEGNNGLAVALIMILPLFRFLQLHTEHIWVRRGLLVAMSLIGISILASYSRGAFLGLSAVMIFLGIRSNKKLIIMPLLIIISLLALSFMPQKWHERVDTIQTYEADASAMGRINAWYFAINIANARPLVGGGYQVFDRNLFKIYAPSPNDYHDAHSIYFEALGEQGYVGLILFLILGGLSLIQGNRIRNLTRGQDELQWAYDLASMVQASLIGYAVGGLFLGLAYFDLYYHLIAILVLTKYCVDQSLKNRPTNKNTQNKISSRIEH